MTKTKRKTTKPQTPTSNKITVLEHLRELKRRAIWVGLTVALGSTLAYFAEHQLVDILLKPSHGQNFIYTSPLGGMNFLFGVCFQLGLVFATPVIIYNLLAYLKPLMVDTTHRFLFWSSAIATVTAAGGLVFGYYIGLPSALHFLLHQFTTAQVRPLITIQAYMSFVAVYLLGSALMFQLPILILFINRITPLKPGTLLKYERHAIVASFLIAFIMNPTPNLVDQMLVVVPVLLMYQVSIGLLWLVHRGDKPAPARAKQPPAPNHVDEFEQALRAIEDDEPASPIGSLAFEPALITTPVAPRAPIQPRSAHQSFDIMPQAAAPKPRPTKPTYYKRPPQPQQQPPRPRLIQ